jgi:polynucleotide 5'-hydroxyl-kinase GRC3/NOL9
MESLDIPREWEDALGEILSNRLRKVVVLGDEDTGKSTLALYLLSKVSERFGVSLVDADIGQKDLGPPATITLGRAEQQVSRFDEMDILDMFFVGSVSPSGHLLPLVVGTRLLADNAMTPFLVVNTTGFIRGAGFALKTFKIELLRPDAILTLERRGELETMVKAFPHIRALRLPVSERAGRKSARERTKRRQKAFRDYFRGSRIVKLKRESLRLQRGSSLKKNLLCGLADRRNNLLGLGVVTSCSDEISILTPVEGEIRIIQLGSMWLEFEGDVPVSIRH